MGNQVEYENLIKSLGEENFNYLVKEYIKEYYQINEIHISNGPYDGGLDLVYFNAEKEVKKNIQITVTKQNIEGKLFEDVEKAKENVDKYSYLSNLDFYISTSISQEKKTKWVRRAEIEYAINLKIIDATKLAGNAEEFPSIIKSLGVIFNINNSKSIFEISQQDKILFNVISSGDNSTKIKRHLVHAFILTTIFQNETISLTNLVESVKKSITAEIDEKKITNEVNYLKSIGEIVGNEHFQLSALSIEKLKKILELNKIQEQQLSDEIVHLLDRIELKHISSEISRKLVELYIQHFSYEIEHINSAESSFTKSTNKIFKQTCKLLKDYGLKDQNQCDLLAKEILSISTSNEFLTKLGASSMFVKLYNSNKLEEYISKSNRSICFDTQVLLRLLCVLYNPNSKDNSIKAISKLVSIIKETDIKIDKFTTNDYIEEVSAHLHNALKIYDYIKLPMFEKIGKTKNVFYNFYRELMDSNQITNMNFREFVEHELLGIQLPDEFDKKFIPIVERRLKVLFENLGYEVANVPFYNEYTNTKKEFEIHLGHTNQNRSKQAIKHDVKTALYMSDQENYYNLKEEIYLDPYLITWDFQFYKLREITKDKHKNYNHWFVYTPQKFIEKIELASFRINPESINETILSIVEADFNNNSKKSFLDVITSIFNSNNVSELKLAQKFANLESDYQGSVESNDEFQIGNQEESHLTIILSNLINYYNNPEIDSSMDDFMKLCMDNSKADLLLDVIEEAITKLINNNFLLEDLVAKIDKLIVTR